MVYIDRAELGQCFATVLGVCRGALQRAERVGKEIRQLRVPKYIGCVLFVGISTRPTDGPFFIFAAPTNYPSNLHRVSMRLSMRLSVRMRLSMRVSA